MTVQEMIKIQGNMSKTWGIYAKIYKAAEIPTTTTVAASAIAQFASLSKKQLSGLNSLTSFQPQSILQKVLSDNNASIKSLTATTKYWEAIGKNLGVQSSFYSTPQPVINDALTKALERFKNASTISYVSSLQRPTSVTKNINDDLFDLINETYYEDEDIKDFEAEEGFSSNTEIQEALEKQVTDPIGFQEKVSLWTEKKKRQFFIVCAIIGMLYNIFIEPYLQEYIGVPVTAWTIAHVKDIPNKAGKFIADLKQDIEATIVENVPYYYKVSFIDENGDLKEGYVSKRSVKFIESDIETEEELKELETDTQE